MADINNGVPMASEERARLIAVKQALMAMAATPGWRYAKQIARNVEQAAITEALDETDPVVAEGLRHEARAARKIFKHFFEVIEATFTFDTEKEPGWFAELDVFSRQEGEGE